jgi:hypothetical protein
MVELIRRKGKGVDQPYITASTISGKDVVFIGDNDFNATKGQTASVDRSLDSAIVPAPAGFLTPFRIETRITSGQDGPQVRTAIASDGKTVYGIFYSWTDYDQSVATVDIVVVKDLQAGNGTHLFTDLKDPQDGSSGVRVATGRRLPWNTPRLGKERVGGDPAIAVDPRDANSVYVAWSDEVQNHYTLHVMHSKDGGATWSKDIRTLTDAKNPGLAVNEQGALGFLYQQVSSANGPRWVTRFEKTNDEFATTPINITLSSFALSELQPKWLPFLGDYLHLMAVGDDFHGVFSASNTADMANFPAGVVFQRNADFNRKVLLGTDNSTVVDPSVDPYYFAIAAQPHAEPDTQASPTPEASATPKQREAGPHTQEASATPKQKEAGPHTQGGSATPASR